MNLNDLLADLEKSSGIEKSASASAPSATGKPAISAELAGVLEKKASADLVKSAHAQGEELARELLSKMANEIQDGNNQMVAAAASAVPTEVGGTVEQVLKGTVDQAIAKGAVSDDRVDPELDKQAKLNKEATMQNTNRSLAKQIMEKLAQDFSAEVTTPSAASSVAGAAVPNMIQTGNALMAAQSDAYTQGVGPVEGTVDDLFQAIVARAKAQGGSTSDIVDSEAPVPRDTIGANDEVEKAAAVTALCGEGLDFDSAVSLVKQAEAELDSEAWEQEKQACMGALMDQGMDFDEAVSLVKQAEYDLIEKQADEYEDNLKAYNKATRPSNTLKDKAKNFASDARESSEEAAGKAKGAIGSYGKSLSEDAKQVGEQLKGLRKAPRFAAEALRGNKAVRLGGGLAGAAALAAGAYAVGSREKKACVEALMDEGIDFDSAVNLVKQAEFDLINGI